MSFKTITTISRMENSLGVYRKWGKSVMMYQNVRVEYLGLLVGSVVQVYSYCDYSESCIEDALYMYHLTIINILITKTANFGSLSKSLVLAFKHARTCEPMNHSKRRIRLDT